MNLSPRMPKIAVMTYAVFQLIPVFMPPRSVAYPRTAAATRYTLTTERVTIALGLSFFLILLWSEYSRSPLLPPIPNLAHPIFDSKCRSRPLPPVLSLFRVRAASGGVASGIIHVEEYLQSGSLLCDVSRRAQGLTHKNMGDTSLDAEKSRSDLKGD